MGGWVLQLYYFSKLRKRKVLRDKKDKTVSVKNAREGKRHYNQGLFLPVLILKENSRTLLQDKETEKD